MKFKFSVVVLALLLCCADVSAQDALQKTLLAQETKLIDAIQQKDERALKEMLAKQTYSVTYAGGRQTEAELVRSLTKVTISKYSLSEIKTIKVSDNVGILTYKFTWEGSEGDKKIPATTVFSTSTWALRDGKWRSVFYQETPVKK